MATNESRPACMKASLTVLPASWIEIGAPEASGAMVRTALAKRIRLAVVVAVALGEHLHTGAAVGGRASRPSVRREACPASPPRRSASGAPGPGAHPEASPAPRSTRARISPAGRRRPPPDPRRGGVHRPRPCRRPPRRRLRRPRAVSRRLCTTSPIGGRVGGDEGADGRVQQAVGVLDQGQLGGLVVGQEARQRHRLLHLRQGGEPVRQGLRFGGVGREHVDGVQRLRSGRASGRRRSTSPRPWDCAGGTG